MGWPAIYILRTFWSTWKSDMKARNLEARSIPRVRGKWPLNLDVMVDWSRSGKEEEVGRMLDLLGREYGGVYNTRVLGEDQVGSSFFLSISAVPGLGIMGQIFPWLDSSIIRVCFYSAFSKFLSSTLRHSLPVICSLTSTFYHLLPIIYSLSSTFHCPLFILSVIDSLSSTLCQ